MMKNRSMKIFRFVVPFLLFIGTARIHSTAEAFDAPAAPDKLAEEPIQKLQPWVGSWEVNAEWTSGQKLWARNEYNVGLGGQFLEANTFAKDGEGKMYHRYKTIFSYDKKEEKFVSYGFTADGKVMIVENKVEEVGGEMSVTSAWSDGGMEVKQTMTFVDSDSFEWKVWLREEGVDEWKQSMVGKWERAAD